MSERFHYERTELTSSIVLWQLFGPAEPEGWEGFLRDATHWLSDQESRGNRWAVLIDPSKMTQVSTAARRVAGEWRRVNVALIANVCTRACYVADSPMIRGAITAVLWFAQPVVEVVVRRTQEEGQAWIEDRADSMEGEASIARLKASQIVNDAP
jgi:hypothetical protein